MKLKPDDIMQEGDVIHYDDGQMATVGKDIGYVGCPVNILPSHPDHSYVTRPTGGRPTKKEAELRQTCVKQQARIEELKAALKKSLLFAETWHEFGKSIGRTPDPKILEKVEEWKKLAEQQ